MLASREDLVATSATRLRSISGLDLAKLVKHLHKESPLEIQDAVPFRVRNWRLTWPWLPLLSYASRRSKWSNSSRSSYHSSNSFWRLLGVARRTGNSRTA